MRLNKLISYLKPKTPDLMKILENELKGHGYIVTHALNFIYATPTTDHVPVLLVAHVDTFHRTMPVKIFNDVSQTTLWSPEGIGGDDRCGVFAVMEIIKQFKCGVLFTDLEESGGIGARDFAREYPKNPYYKMAIQLDRKNGDDCVFYDNDQVLFHEYIETFGFKTSNGTFSDISVIAPKWEINAVNLSVGYYNEHTYSEYIDYSLTQRTIDRVVKMLSNPIPSFKYMELANIWDYRGYNATGNYEYTDRWSNNYNTTLNNNTLASNTKYGLNTCDYCGEKRTLLYEVKDLNLCTICNKSFTITCDFCGEDTLDFDVTVKQLDGKAYDICSACVDSVDGEDVDFGCYICGCHSDDEMGVLEYDKRTHATDQVKLCVNCFRHESEMCSICDDFFLAGNITKTVLNDRKIQICDRCKAATTNNSLRSVV